MTMYALWPTLPSISVSTGSLRQTRPSAETVLRTPPEQVSTIGAGGLSGPGLAHRSMQVLRLLRSRVGDRLVLVSVGGITTAEDAWARIRAGATLLQGYTGFIYGGPLWAQHINDGLARRLRMYGFGSVPEAIGTEELREYA